MSAFNETLNISSSLGGQFAVQRSGVSRISRRIPLPAAKSGTVTSGTTSRILTLGTGHGITTSNLVGVFWSGGQRIDMIVTAADATTITVTAASGTGTAFPVNTTAIAVSVATPRAEIGFAAAGLQILTVGSDPQQAPFSVAANFLDGTTVSLLAVAAIGGECYFWAANTGLAAPIAGTVASVNCYSSSLFATEILFGILLA